MKPSHNSPKSTANAPKDCIEIGRLLGTVAPSPMSPWQVCGFAHGLICGLGALPAEAFSAEEDPEDMLYLDCLDELSRKIEDEECPVGPEDLAAKLAANSFRDKFLALVADAEQSLLSQSGMPDLACSSAAASAQNPALADVPAARAFARGLLRGLVMSVEDEEDLAKDAFGEPLSLLFILTEEDLGAEFGSAKEVNEARQAVAMALPGLVAQLWQISHDEESESDD